MTSVDCPERRQRVLRSVRQEGDQYLVKCVYHSWSIQLCFTVVGGYGVQVCSDEEISHDWVFGKGIHAQKKAIDWFMRLVADLCSTFRLYDCPSGDSERSPANSQPFTVIFDCDERDIPCAQ
jgi:hypothetical protein